MSEEFRLPARVQPQVWVNDNAVDSGPVRHFDAHVAMLSQSPEAFAYAARQILDGRHDIDDLALESSVVSDLAGEPNCFTVTVDEEDFAAWLDGMGLSAEEAVSMTAGRLKEVRRLGGECVLTDGAGRYWDYDGGIWTEDPAAASVVEAWQAIHMRVPERGRWIAAPAAPSPVPGA